MIVAHARLPCPLALRNALQEETLTYTQHASCLALCCMVGRLRIAGGKRIPAPNLRHREPITPLDPRRAEEFSKNQRVRTATAAALYPRQLPAAGHAQRCLRRDEQAIDHLRWQR